MKTKRSPREFITFACARIAMIEDFNRRCDACVRMHDLKERGRSFDFIEGSAFDELSKVERERLERARPVVAHVMQRLRQKVYGLALAQNLEEHYRDCSGVKPHDPHLPQPKKSARGYYATTEDSESFWKFLQGGAPGLIQQK